MQLLRLRGHSPNLSTDSNGALLEANNFYNFDFESQSFFVHDQGIYNDGHIKMLRLLMHQEPHKVAVVGGADQIQEDLEGLLKSLVRQSIS